MRRQQVTQHLDADAEEEEMSTDFESRASQNQDKSEGSQILGAVFNPSHYLHIIVVPADPQELALIKEEAPEQQRTDVDQLDPENPHIKEEEEELWTSPRGEQLSVKEEEEETDATSFTAVSVKSEDDEEKPLFPQLHQVEIGDLPTSSSADLMDSASDGEFCEEAYTTRNLDLSTHEDDSDFSETEVSEDDEDVNNPNYELKHLSDSGSNTEDTDKDWESSLTRVPESGVNILHNKNEQKPFCCGLCGQRLSQKGHLNRHMKIHTGQKQFCCGLCGQKFPVKDSLNRHMKIHAGQKPFSCDVCERTFTLKGSLNKHVKIHTGQKPFSCNLCEQRFTEKGSLNRHMRIHTGQKPFCCDLCKQKFTEKGNLNTHMRTHTGKKPYSCHLCERSFSVKCSLNKHMSTHTGHKPFCCNVCDRRFSQKGNLNKHIRIHTGQKPFCCDLCGRRFTTKHSLNTHMIIHTRNKAVICNKS